MDCSASCRSYPSRGRPACHDQRLQRPRDRRLREASEAVNRVVVRFRHLDQVFLVAGFWRGEIGALDRQRLAAAITRYLSQLVIPGALPPLVAGSIIQQDSVATREQLLVGLSNGRGIAFKGGERNIKSKLSAKLAQGNCSLAVLLVADQVDQLPAPGGAGRRRFVAFRLA